jgi:uncharacterized SAM-binding protein YcdF (DUF218 family)
MKPPSKILFIPSHGVTAFNNIAGTGSLNRCEKALEIWNPKKYDYIVTSGGIGQDKTIQTIATGELMKRWLVKNGIPEDRILSEVKSLETYTNIHYSLKLLKKKNIRIKSFTVVSLWSHILRIKIILWRNYKIKALSVSVKHKLSLFESILEPIWFINHLLDKTGNGLVRRLVRRYLRERRLN